MQIIYLGAVVLGLLIPFVILYITRLLDTKINTIDDLDAGLKNISILGEMPFVEDTTIQDTTGRGLVAESTRVLRSSLSFQLQTQKSKCIASNLYHKRRRKVFCVLQFGTKLCSAW